MINSVFIFIVFNGGVSAGIRSGITLIAALFKRACDKLLIDYLNREYFSKVLWWSARGRSRVVAMGLDSGSFRASKNIYL